MGVAALTIVVSVLAGTLLALLPRQKNGWMGPMRTFGLAAALSVVALHMVPESVEAIGAWTVPGLLLGLALPALLGRLGSFLWRAGNRAAEPRHVALEAGYAGLLVHKVGDGIALGVYAGELHPTAGSHGFAAALAAHIVPVVAIVVLTFDSVRGRGSALLRALGLALAGLLGVFLTRSVALAEVSEAHGWLSAIAAGMLLHVVTHDLGLDLPKTVLGRSVDFGVAALGLLVSAFGGESHGAHGAGDAPPIAEALLASLLGLSEGTALVFVLALLASATLAAATDRRSGSWLLLGSAVPVHWSARPLLPGALVRRCETSPSGVVFLFFLPGLALETTILTMSHLGVSLGLLQWTGGFLLASGAALGLRLGLRAPSASTPVFQAAGFRAGGFWRRLVAAFDELFLRLGAFMALGLLLAALVDVSFDPGDPHGLLPLGLQIPFVLLIALPAYACAPSAVPLAAVLLAKGLTPGAALLGLLLGAAVVPAGRSCLRAWLGPSAIWLGLMGGLVAVVSFSCGVDLWLPTGMGTPEAAPSGGSGMVGLIALSVSGLALARVIYRASFRGFLLPLEGGHAAEGGVEKVHSAHHHGHAHGFPAHPPAGADDQSDAAGLDAPRTGLKIPEP